MDVHEEKGLCYFYKIISAFFICSYVHKFSQIFILQFFISTFPLFLFLLLSWSYLIRPLLINRSCQVNLCLLYVSLVAKTECCSSDRRTVPTIYFHLSLFVFYMCISLCMSIPSFSTIQFCWFLYRYWHYIESMVIHEHVIFII